MRAPQSSIKSYKISYTGSEGGPEPHAADGPVHSSGHTGNDALLTPENSLEIEIILVRLYDSSFIIASGLL